MSADSFDARASAWDDDPAKIERARVAASAIRAAVPLSPTTRLLEYGAGTGLVSEALQEDVGPITMADTSAGMRAVLDDKIAGGRLRTARAWDVDLSQGVVPDEDFDLIVTVMALHHISDLDPVLLGFGQLLVPGGHLCVVDLEEEDGSFHDEGFDGHRGFSRDVLSSKLVSAGFIDTSFQPCHEVVRHGVPYPLFLATAVRGGAQAPRLGAEGRPS